MMNAQLDTKEVIMAAAKLMVQAHGYNALSFRDLAAAVGVKSSSIHYHFPTKGNLGAALAGRYCTDMETYLSDVLASHKGGSERIKAFTAAFRAALANNNRMCLCGIMAAEHDDLPAEVNVEVDRFATICINWLSTVLSEIRPAATQEDNDRQGLALYGAILGAQLVARGKADITLYDQAIAGFETLGLLG
jgi:TetR/AcrR family transcriptional regulator, transcriptional repressor for nem operon